MRWAIVAVGLAAGVSGARGQSLAVVPANTSPGLGPTINPATQFVAFNRAVEGGGTELGSASVALPTFVDYLRGQVAPAAPSTIALADIANRLDRLNARFSEGIALAGAINVLPPEPGRKISISVGGAGYNGAAAASVAVAARFNEETIGYIGVAQGPTQTLVKGGIGWSPW